jgi:hypothetical protein
MQTAGKPTGGRKKIPLPHEEAEAATYRLPTGQLFLVGSAAMGTLRGAATGMQVKTVGPKMTAKKALAGGVQCFGDAWPLFHPKTLEPISEYEIYTCRAVVQGKGVMRSRPLIREWACDIELEYDTEVFTDDVLHGFFKRAGQFCGVGDQRPGSPSTPGPYGTFDAVIVSQDEHDQTVKKAAEALKKAAKKAATGKKAKAA